MTVEELAGHERHTKEAPTSQTSRGLDGVSWRYAARRALHGFVRHRGLDSAAALTFFATLALFPASLVVVSSFAIAENRTQASDTIIAILGDFARDSTVESIKSPLDQLLSIPIPGLALGIGLALSVWSVSSYATAFGRAVNSVYEVQEGRQFWKFRGLMMVLALVLIVGFACVTAILLGTPAIAEAFASNLRVDPIWLPVWNIGKWPALLVLAIAMVGILYYYTPNVRHLRLRWVSWGAAFAIVAWAIATVGFAIYVMTFQTYNHVYGWLGGAVIVLIWLYITNLVLVLGAELDAEVVRLRQLTAGVEAEVIIQLPIRDSRRNLMLARQRAADEADGRAIRVRAAEKLAKNSGAGA
jgi:membrane protein